MHVIDILKKKKMAVSFEFFPPKAADGATRLYNTINALTPLEPAYVSVTYGAGGSTRELTHELIQKIRRETDLTVVSHLTCVSATKDDIHEVLQRYEQSGIDNIMALRGDPPQGEETFTRTEGGFGYASELVAFIKKKFPHMGIGVAGYVDGHHETPNRLTEMDHLKRKVDAGADYICTQLFFDNRDFYDFCERCELAGIRVPIIPGIMPITSLKGMGRMADLAMGSRFPARLLKSLERAEDDKYVRNVGVHWATEQVRDLLDNGISAIHFYTLNRSRATREIYETLGVTKSGNLV